MSDTDVPDSTDWLSTPLSGLAAVESALRCQVCKDFYKTPVITSCSHTFCSLCIRRALGNDGKCPLCRAPDQELRLRSNWSMEETVEAFVKARTVALDLAHTSSEANSLSKRKAQDGPNEATDAPEGKRLRTSSRLRKTRTNESVTDPAVFEDEEIMEVPDDDEYLPDPGMMTDNMEADHMLTLSLEDGLVPCPVCQTRMKDWQVFKHLEGCPGPTSPKQRKAGESSSSSFGVGQLQRQQTKPVERLPALNYSMLKEQALRKKMADLGISNQGPRVLLERRHKEWITLWNANCDAARPKNRGKLLQDLDIWERTQGGRAPVTGRAVQSAAVIKDKDFDGAAWASKHDSSFKDLIANARKSRMEAKKKAEEGKGESSTEPSPAAPVPPQSQPEVLQTSHDEIPPIPAATYPNHLSQDYEPVEQFYEQQVHPPQTSESLSYQQPIHNDHWDSHQIQQPPSQEAWQPTVSASYPSASYPMPHYSTESYAYRSSPNAHFTSQSQPAPSWNSGVSHSNPSPYAPTGDFTDHGSGTHAWPPGRSNDLP
ncbi:hypothetical protein AK830_g6487 [Neonectria ditissima]|uniref:Postreplication repair E3 ubiquitin-protein ligase RAD18 n=1 Tax=Neonectria ditissima TaxID=78410 RepID=A0A0P7BJ18_9HYPO|nr:hypothetical protein AK830_g6487 [Neonectria ditissima]